jgi:hypothetical protein
MTVSSTASRVVYIGDASRHDFPFAFKVMQPSDLTVVFTDATGDDFILSPDDYTVVGLGLDAGGQVTYQPDGVPIASGTRLTIWRDVPLTQPTSLSNQGAMWPQVLEAALDRLTFIAQRLADLASRALVTAPTDSPAPNLLPNSITRANSTLAFDSAGQPYAATLVSSLAGVATWLFANFLAQATSAAAARTAIGAAGLGGDETIAGNKTLTGTIDITAGRAKVPTRSAGDNGTDAASTAFAKTKAESVVGGAVLRSYLAGLGLANNSGTPNSKVDVAAGVCADDTNAQMLALSAGTIDCATTGANGLDAGTLANGTWYHVFAIGKTDGTVARLASASLGSPTLPAGYTLKRRIGSFRTNGSAQILAFVQEGDLFLWAVEVNDVAGASQATPSAITLSVPTGLSVEALFNGINNSGGDVRYLFYSALLANIAYATGHTNGQGVSGTGNGGSGQFRVRTNTSGQIKFVANTAVNPLYVWTSGWIDRRGRDA